MTNAVNSVSAANNYNAGDCGVLYAEKTLTAKADKEKLAVFFLETLGAKAVSFIDSAVLALQTTGKDSGLVVDSGYEVTHATPVYWGYPVRHAVLRLDVAGKDITKFFQKISDERGTSLSSLEIAEDIKEELCYVA